MDPRVMEVVCATADAVKENAAIYKSWADEFAEEKAKDENKTIQVIGDGMEPSNEVAEEKAKAENKKALEKADAALVMEKKALEAKAIYEAELTKIRAGRGKKGKEPMSDAPIIPKGILIPVRPDFEVGKDKRVGKLHVAMLDVRHRIWESINGTLSFKDPVVGPFEVALPPWLDFHGLIWGENGELYERLISSIHEFLTVGWIIAGGRPSCLVVGFKPPNQDPASEDPASRIRHWHDLTTLWEDVVTWVSQARYGNCTTLLDSLTIQHWKRMAVASTKSQGRLTGAQSASERDLAAEE
ncbi:hypothetical protein FPSE5266_01626 [Fusarium pseudograminearum]|nr:hypothetical protein FPSE5266_01626 [Fusarium pseudograminearum]